MKLLCNTAGVSQFGPVENATYDDWDWQIDVNLKGVINGIVTFVPHMIKHGQGGHILNTASMSAFVSTPGATIYTTSKYAVRDCRKIKMDLSKHNIGVSCLCPGGLINIHEAVLSAKSVTKHRLYGADPEVFKQLKSAIDWVLTLLISPALPRKESGATTCGFFLSPNSFRRLRKATGW